MSPRNPLNSPLRIFRLIQSHFKNYNAHHSPEDDGCSSPAHTYHHHHPSPPLRRCRLPPQAPPSARMPHSTPPDWSATIQSEPSFRVRPVLFLSLSLGALCPRSDWPEVFLYSTDAPQRPLPYHVTTRRARNIVALLRSISGLQLTSLLSQMQTGKRPLYVTMEIL